MKNFILGIIFVVLILPFFQYLSNILQYITEYVCYKIAQPTYEIKKRMGIEEEEEQETNPIGFCSTQAIGYDLQSSNQEEYEEDRSHI